jgi:hypothetical protein
MLGVESLPVATGVVMVGAAGAVLSVFNRNHPV